MSGCLHAELRITFNEQTSGAAHGLPFPERKWPSGPLPKAKRSATTLESRLRTRNMTLTNRGHSSAVQWRSEYYTH
eukprot:gene13719-4010_t